MFRLDGKRILVTAAAAGIGKAAAELAAEFGGKVLATDLNLDAVQELRDAVSKTERLDVTDTEAVQELVEKEGPFDGIVNAAGVVVHGTLDETDPSDWKRSFLVNVDSIYFVLRSAVPAMVENGGGSVVNIASAAGSLKAFPSRFAYGATKAAVIGMTKSVASDYVAKGIRCNAVCPGTVDTPSLRQRIVDFGENIGDYEEARKFFVERQPMGRLGTAEEIAALVVYLLSDASAYTTGQTHVVDGGILA